MVLNPQTVDLMHAAADAKFERKTPSEELKPKPSIPLRPPNLKKKKKKKKKELGTVSTKFRFNETIKNKPVSVKIQRLYGIAIY